MQNDRLPLYVWLATAPHQIRYDEYDGVVVVAATAIRAREIVKAHLGSAPWRKPAILRRIGVAGTRQKEGVVLASFNAG